MSSIIADRISVLFKINIVTIVCPMKIELNRETVERADL